MNLDPSQVFQSYGLVHTLYGAAGGLLYLLRRLTRSYRIKPGEFIGRPIFGAVSSYLVNASMDFPHHPVVFCVFVGYFGVDVFEVIAQRVEAQLERQKLKKPPASREEDEPRLDI